MSPPQQIARAPGVRDPCSLRQRRYSGPLALQLGVRLRQREQIFAWHLTSQSAIAALQRRISVSTGGKYAASYLVCHCWFSCRLCRQGALAYASVNHVDHRARDCRLDHRRGRNASVLPAKRGRPISSRGDNRLHPWSDSGSLSLAQVQAATASRIEIQSNYRGALTLAKLT